MEKSHILISRGTSEDYMEITELWKESVKATHHFLGIKDYLELERDMPDKFLPAVKEIWLCRRKSHLAGFCGNNGGHVEMLFVHPAFMRQGIGAMLLAHLKRLYGPLSVEVNEENTGARAFYEYCGFCVTGRFPLDGQGRAYPILRMEQRIRDYKG